VWAALLACAEPGGWRRGRVGDDHSGGAVVPAVTEADLLLVVGPGVDAARGRLEAAVPALVGAFDGVEPRVAVSAEGSGQLVEVAGGRWSDGDVTWVRAALALVATAPETDEGDVFSGVAGAVEALHRPGAAAHLVVVSGRVVGPGAVARDEFVGWYGALDAPSVTFSAIVDPGEEVGYHAVADTFGGATGDVHAADWGPTVAAVVAALRP
jgi:hypothetical protein